MESVNIPHNRFDADVAAAGEESDEQDAKGKKAGKDKADARILLNAQAPREKVCRKGGDEPCNERGDKEGAEANFCWIERVAEKVHDEIGRDDAE